MRRLTRYEMSSVDGEIYLDSSNTRVINAAEAKVCLAIDVGDLENDLYEQEEKTKQYKVLYQEKCRDINTQERFFALEKVHQKYKRCLAMAQEWRNYAAFCGMQSHCHNHRGFGKTADKYTWKECHAWKCMKRYKELAEKFKPNSTAR